MQIVGEGFNIASVFCRIPFHVNEKKMFKPNFINLPTISKLHVFWKIVFKDFIVKICSEIT